MNLSNDPQIQKELKKENLRYCSDGNPGFFRQKSGKDFRYYDLDGKWIRDSRTLNRINKLVIPPAWKNVWVCPKNNGHLQATGIDDKGRKQYLYHPDWIKITKQNKFSKMVDFGLSLPIIREKIRYGLQLKNLEKRKILSVIVWLLEHTFIRVGNEEYSRDNNSFGLTTLHNKHIAVRGSEIVFKFRGKSGVSHVIKVSSPIIAKTIKRCIELPGYEIFQFIDENGNRHVVDSADVNLYLKDLTKHDFSAKDFRTWGGTSISANHFYKLGHPGDKKIIQKNIVETVKTVATHLGNTVSVCRSYYIHPTVIKTYEDNILVPHFAHTPKTKQHGLSWDEHALVTLLKKHPAVNF
jgi:DNA topoisomerase I